MTEAVSSSSNPSERFRLRDIVSSDQCNALQDFTGKLTSIAELFEKELRLGTAPHLEPASEHSSNPNLGQFLNSIGFAQTDLDRMFESADRLLRHLEDARPAFILVLEETERFVQSPPVAGYEDLLIGEGYYPYAARLLARILGQLGKELVEQRRAERKLSSAIYTVATVKHATPLVISRRAQSVIAALGNDMALSMLNDACVEAGIAVSSLRDLAECARARDATACLRLFDTCRALKPLVVDPRGLIRSVASATHELYLSVVKRAYTYDAHNGAFVDPATRATRIAMNLPKFDPRSARRRIRQREKAGGSPRGRPH